MHTRKAHMSEQEDYRSLLNDIPAMICCFCKDGTITYVNNAYCDCFELSPEELIGQSFINRIPETDHLRVMEIIRALSLENSKQTYDLNVTGKDGKTRWHRWTIRAVLDDKGHVERYHTLGEDITKQKRDEELIRAERDLLERITETSPAGIIRLDVHGLIVYANKRVEEVGGVRREDIYQKYSCDSIWRITDFDGNYVPLKDMPFFEIRRTGKPVYNVHHAIEMPNGRKIFLSINAAPLLSPSGEFDGVVLSLDDITESHASQERFLTVLDGIEAAVYVADMETYEILFMNKKMINAVGRDMTGEICWKSLRNELRPCPYCTNDQLLTKEGDAQEVCVWQDENPETGRHYINQDRAIKWTDGRLARMQIATDVTEMKVLEARLQQAQKLESIGNLASGIAHDFNNILFPIIGMSDILLEELPLGCAERDSVVEILKAGKRGSDLVKQILSFSRNNENKKIPVRIQHVLSEVLSLVRSTTPSDTHIHMEINKDCGLVMATPTHIHQIVMNLITNAFHAVEHNGGQIEVRLDPAEMLPADPSGLSPGSYVTLSVSDTGHGIEPSHMEKIFDPYFTTKAQEKGTGLGLSVVYGIVKDHQGDIRVSSEPGRGATFTVWFPVMDPAFMFKKADTQKTAPTGNETILVVDDEAPIASLEARILTKLGYRVHAYTNSLEALEAFRHGVDDYDLVITDMTMPGINGSDLAKELMAVKPDIPIILCTGFSERMNRSKAKEMGIRGFLMKPVEKAELAPMVRNVLDASKKIH